VLKLEIKQIFFYRYSFRESLTNAVVQHLVNKKKTIIKTNGFIKNIAIYKYVWVNVEVKVSIRVSVSVIDTVRVSVRVKVRVSVSVNYLYVI